jgi:hypothetical protein
VTINSSYVCAVRKQNRILKDLEANYPLIEDRRDQTRSSERSRSPLSERESQLIRYWPLRNGKKCKRVVRSDLMAHHMLIEGDRQSVALS